MEMPARLATATAATAASAIVLATVHQTSIDAGDALILLAALALLTRTLIRLAAAPGADDADSDARAERTRRGAHG
jgi:hypothetical protein